MASGGSGGGPSDNDKNRRDGHGDEGKKGGKGSKVERLVDDENRGENFGPLISSKTATLGITEEEQRGRSPSQRASSTSRAGSRSRRGKKSASPSRRTTPGRRLGDVVLQDISSRMINSPSKEAAVSEELEDVDKLIDGNKISPVKARTTNTDQFVKPPVALVPTEAKAETKNTGQEEEEEEEGPQVQMRRIFALRSEIHSSRRNFEKEFRDRKKKLKAGLKKVKADIKTEEKGVGNREFQKQTQVLDENMKRMAETIRKDEEETKELCARTTELLARVAEVKQKVEAGVLELRASMEQEAKVRRELLEQKNVLSDDIAQLKQLLASMHGDLHDDEGVHRNEVAQLGLEGVQEANHLRHELVGIRMGELGHEMSKLDEDIVNTEKLMADASKALEEKEEDRLGLMEMQEALQEKLIQEKLMGQECDQADVEAIESELALLEDKLQMIAHSCEAIGRCMESYQFKIDAARLRIVEVRQEETVSRDPLVCATPRESAHMHGALVGASHHSTASCLHPKVGEASAALASTTTYTGRLDSENMGLDLAADPDNVPEDITDETALALPPLPPSAQTDAPDVSAQWTERRTAALSAATRPVNTPTPLGRAQQKPVSKPVPTPADDKLDDAKSSLESMESLQQELEEWQGVLEAKVSKMEASGDDEEDINTMRSELDTVKEKLGLHVKDIENITQEIARIEAEI